MASKNLKSTRRAGFYFIDKKPYISVTTVLTVINKPQIVYWYGRQVYLALVKNPSLSEKDALAAPYQSTRGAMSRGTTVHSIVEAYKHTKEQLDVPEEFRGYAKAFYKFVTERKAKIKEQEKTVISKTLKVAGTLDLLASIDDIEVPLVIDVKTGKDIYEESFLQTSAYRFMLLENGIFTRGIGTLLLLSNGEYKFQHEVEEPVLKIRMDAFLSAKKLYEGLNHETLQKVGYYDEVKK
jgi:hypothetical protein